ncbi:MAG: HU family DNA-binding protein [Candidatus Kryptoniota bacterium]
MDKLVEKVEEKLKQDGENGELKATKKLASELVDFVYDGLYERYIEELVNGNKIITPIGAYYLFQTAPREFYNMASKKKEKSKGRTTVKFKANSPLKKLLNPEKNKA